MYPRMMVAKRTMLTLIVVVSTIPMVLTNFSSCSTANTSCDSDSDCVNCMTSLEKFGAQVSLVQAMESQQHEDFCVNQTSPSSAIIYMFNNNCDDLYFRIVCATKPLADTMSYRRQMRTNLQWAMSAMGAISLIVCLYVICVILSTKRDLMFVRDRLILGLMVGSVIYSIANIFPIWAYEQKDSFSYCVNVHVLTKSQTCFARGLWIMGKFVLGLYEFFIAAVSIHVLRYGTNPKHEKWVHIAVALMGCISFVGFVASCDRDFAGNLNEHTIHNSTQWSDDYHAYNADVRLWLMLWLVPMCATIAAWVYMRFLLHKLLRIWESNFIVAQKQWDRDLWAPENQDQRRTKERLLQMQRAVFLEIVKPLEPFVVVFTVYSLVVLMMSTQQCTNLTFYGDVNKPDEGDFGRGLCFVPCEFVLSTRAIATALAFFWSSKEREELRSPVVHLQLLWLRVSEYARLVCCGQHGARARFSSVLAMRRYSVLSARSLSSKSIGSNSDVSVGGDGDTLADDHARLMEGLTSVYDNETTSPEYAYAAHGMSSSTSADTNGSTNAYITVSMPYVPADDSAGDDVESTDP
eukprot:m.1298300 g.1298300  ORF g.1298300 m.1298300 type:complete len:577 (+) comp24798_c1_seq66:179-1909(+)